MAVTLEDRMPPVMWREMRSVMRGNRAPLMLFVCSAVAVTVGWLLLSLEMDRPLAPEAYAVIGRKLFFALLAVEMLVVVALVPLLTSSTLAREHQLRTMDDLLLTKLTGQEIAFGKLASALSFIVVGLLCTIPVLAIAFFLGGVSPWELLLSQGLLLCTAFAMGAFGVYCSGLFRNQFAALGVILVGVLLGSVSFILLGMTPAIAELIQQFRAYRKAAGIIELSALVVLYIIVFAACGGPLIALILLAAVSIPSPAIAFGLLVAEGTPFSGLWWALSLCVVIIALLLGRFLLNKTADLIRPREIDSGLPEESMAS